jgi:putative protease
MLELLSPAGSIEALHAAVQNGADAVYLGAGSFNARMQARNFTEEELAEAVSYCHIRGVKVHLTLNTLVSDRELPQAAEEIVSAARAGVDAFIVQDLGIVSLCRQMAPGVALHASTQMSLHSLEGAREAEQLGLSRIVPARELPRDELAYLCRHSPIEVEAFVHGALCMSYSGQCYLSAMIGQRSGNRGRCAQPCRLPYGYGRAEQKYPLSLKDNCLIGFLSDLDAIGVTSLKIEGRMKRPEYVAIATRVYRDAIDGHAPSAEQLDQLRQVFSRQGFTSGYYEGKLGPQMFGTRSDERPDRALFAQARATYESGELRQTPIRYYAVVAANQPAMLAAEDDQGHICKTTGPVPEFARTRELTEDELAARLAKTGGTPYRSTGCRAILERGLTLSAADINAMRRDVLSHLTAVRGRVEPPEIGRYTAPRMVKGQTGRPSLTVEVYRAGQITPEVLRHKPAVLYVPLEELAEHPNCIQGVPPETAVCAVLPRVIHDSESTAVLRKLDRVYDLGVRQALLGNLGHLTLARSRGFAVRGDFGLNLFNSRAMKELYDLGLTSATASFEMSFPQIRDLSKDLPTEIIAYGRLPLMLTENCLIHNRNGVCACNQSFTLTDRKGENFPVVRDPGTCRSVVLNGKKLYLLDRQKDLANLGIWAARLRFTTENPSQVGTVLRAWDNAAPFDPGACTRGLYARGVE